MRGPITGVGAAVVIAVITGTSLQTAVQAQELSPEEEMARKAQDPLGKMARSVAAGCPRRGVL